MGQKNQMGNQKVFGTERKLKTQHINFCNAVDAIPGENF